MINLAFHSFENDVLAMYTQYIYGQGGRYFWIHNTGPIGCLPYVLDRLPVLAAQVDNAGCAIPYNKVAQFFNRGLKQAVVQLRKDLPLAAITYVDVYSAKYSLISQPEKHGKFLLNRNASFMGWIN